MSGLLHIKRFRQNMFKLFVIYIVVMLSTTSVITYSRYITSMESTAYARPARFDIEIDQGDVCVANTNICKEGSGVSKFKPYDQLDYYFTVDTSQLEVTTDMDTTITIDSHFNFVSIYEKNSDDEEYSELTINEDYTVSSRAVYVYQKVIAGEGSVKSYKIRISYRENSTNNPNFDEAVLVNFVAKQVD